KVKDIRNALGDLLVQVAVNLDYPDEDIEEMTYEKLIESISQIDDHIWRLLRTAHTGRIVSEGLAVTIVGKPNVGKSSLMNALLKESRAIVTEIAGTTRDTIEEMITIKGIPIKLTDTAGIRETADTIEKIGIEKSKEAFNKSDLLIFLIDASQDLEEADLDIIKYLENKKAIVLLNKIDLGREIKAKKIKEYLPKAIILEISVKHETGIEQLEDQIEQLVYGGDVKQNDSMLITNVRHKNLLEQGKKAMEDAKKMAELGEALDFIEVDLKNAYQLLGEMVGESVTDDIIDKVFERFCLGK
ncbi:MAG: tRNA uridine-5-carboxymethylaminomethyl(34) synthesis GTPase MnmE, partial [Anaerovorax sp.]